MIRKITKLGCTAIVLQILAVLFARYTIVSWQGSETTTAAVFSAGFVQFMAMPSGLLGLLSGAYGMLRMKQWGRPRALRFAMALCVIGMIPFGMFEFTWHGAWAQRIREHQATRR